MNKSTIQVTIVDDNEGETCGVQCGVDWSLPEVLTLARQRIKDRFGNTVKLEYMALTQPDTNGYTQEMRQQVEDKNVSLPLLMINGNHRISGQFDMRMLLDIIEAEIEILNK